MEARIVNGYYVAGNEHLAIAINVKDGEDAHWFRPDEHEEVLDAYTKAVAWTSPGI